MKNCMIRIFCAVAILGYAAPAFAKDALTPESLDLKIIRLGDLELSCEDLSQEAMLMQDIVATTQNIKDETNLQKHGITAVGAVGSLLVGTMTGGIGLAAAGLFLDHNIGEKSQSADSVQDIAEQRRTLMLGIHTAKGCEDTNIKNAMIDPEPAKLIELTSIEPASGDDNAKPKKLRYNE